jgi:hypothetical protein
MTAAVLRGLLLVTAGAAATVQRDADEFFDHARIAEVRGR